MEGGRLPAPAHGAWLRRSPALNSGKLTLSTGRVRAAALAAVLLAVPSVALNENDSTSGTCTKAHSCLGEQSRTDLLHG